MWNEALGGDVPTGYCGSKKLTDRQVMLTIVSRHASYGLTGLPTLWDLLRVYGPLARTIKKVEQIKESNGRIYKQ